MPSHPKPVRVAIAQDYPVLVRGLAAILGAQPDRFELVALDAVDASDGGGLPVSAVDVVLHDDFSSAQELAAFIASTDGKVVVLASARSRGPKDEAMLAGAAGYLFKAISEERLLLALEHVHSGGRVVELSVVPGPEIAFRAWPGRELGLSTRESEVLGLICRGLTNEGIAETLFLSVNSVKTYARTMYRKIGVERRSQAVLFGLSIGLPNPATAIGVGPALGSQGLERP